MVMINLPSYTSDNRRSTDTLCSTREEATAQHT